MLPRWSQHPLASGVKTLRVEAELAKLMLCIVVVQECVSCHVDEFVIKEFLPRTTRGERRVENGTGAIGDEDDGVVLLVIRGKLVTNEQKVRTASTHLVDESL